MARKDNIVKQGATKRDAVAAPGYRRPDPIDQATRDTILSLLSEGATLAECFTIRGITSYGAFYATRTAVPEFDAEVRKAMAQGAEAAIAEAAELTRSAATSGNPDDMRVAESFSRCATSYAEKAAPREYGQLIKLGNADGGPLSVQVVSYAIPALTQAPALVPIEGKFERGTVDTRTRDDNDDFAA